VSLPALGYLAVLLEHAAYAAWLIRTRRADLSIGPIRTPTAILAGLLLLNGFSLGCFFWPAPLFLNVSLLFQLVLEFHELRLTRKRLMQMQSGPLLRLPFVMNHVLFITALMMMPYR
jgi:hypothetical protein